MSEANLEVERFGLPNKPTGTPEQLEELVRCGDWGRAPALPLAPYPAATPQALRRQLPLHRGAKGNPSGVALTLRVQGSRGNGFELFTAERELEARAARKETGI